MNKHTLSVPRFGFVALAAGMAIAFAACSDDEDPSPSRPPPVGSGGSSGSAGSGPDASAGTGGVAPDGGGGSGGDSGFIPEAGNCQEDSATACFECTINGNNVSFLNRCTTATGIPFDNAARINRSGWQPGQPLPTP